MLQATMNVLMTPSKDSISLVAEHLITMQLEHKVSNLSRVISKKTGFLPMQKQKHRSASQ